MCPHGLDCFEGEALIVYYSVTDMMPHNPAMYQWNKPSIDFYEQKLGAIAMSDWLNMRLNEDGIIRLREFDTTRQGDVKN